MSYAPTLVYIYKGRIMVLYQVSIIIHIIYIVSRMHNGFMLVFHNNSHTVEPQYSELIGGVVCSDSEMFGLSEKRK